MKQAFLNQSISFIMKNQDKYTEEDKEKLLYGLEGIYLTITKTIILFGISFLMGFTKDFILYLIPFSIIRYPAFGFHADTSRNCLFISGCVFLILPYLMLKFHLSIVFKIVMYSLIFLIFLICAPADTVKRPLTNRKKRKMRKIASMAILILYGIFIFTLSYPFSEYFLIASFIEAFFISPIPYWMFRQPYNNYKKGLNRNV